MSFAFPYTYTRSSESSDLLSRSLLTKPSPHNVQWLCWFFFFLPIFLKGGILSNYIISPSFSVLRTAIFNVVLVFYHFRNINKSEIHLQFGYSMDKSLCYSSLKYSTVEFHKEYFATLDLSDLRLSCFQDMWQNGKENYLQFKAHQ